MSKDELKELILKKAENGRISCSDAGDIADQTGTPKNEVGRLIDELKIKIVACQLGCF